VNVDPRLLRAREALDTAGQHPIETLPPSVMARELAELRQVTAGLAEYVEEWPTPFVFTDAEQAAAKAELVAGLPSVPEPGDVNDAAAEVIVEAGTDTARQVALWLRQAREATDAAGRLATDALAAVLEALNIPHPATVSDEQVRDEILAVRVMHTVVFLEALARDREIGLDPARSLAYFRDKLAEHPATGYRTWHEAVAEARKNAAGGEKP
jgi:hypothetical protein